MSTQQLIAFLSILIVIAALLFAIIFYAASPTSRMDGAVIALLSAILGGLVREIGNLLPRDSDSKSDKEDKD